ncbi:MAG: DUF1592 domain-containing protein [Polyangiaceae bacterium]
MRKTLSTLLVAATAVATLQAAGCVGSIGAGDEDNPLGKPPGEKTPQGVECKANQAGEAPLRRLTRAEYRRTVTDLLGSDLGQAEHFAIDASVGSFYNNTNAPVTVLLATQLMEAAEALSASAAATLDTLVPCDPAAPGDEQACLDGFLDSFGKRAYRRPLSDAEKGRYQALFDRMRTELSYGFGDAMRVVLNTILQAPAFVYHVEPGGTAEGDATTVRVGGYELASRLSYFLWGTMPDDDLLAAAESGDLDSDEGLKAEVDRMLDDDRAKEGLRAMYGQWMMLEKLAVITKDPSFYDGYDEAAAAVFREGTEAFVDEVLWEGDARLETLLTASFAYVDETLADIYGVTKPAGEGLQRVELDPEQRAGILTQASVMAIQAHAYQTSPVFRGKFVRERLLCQTLPSPPGDVDVSPPEPDPTLTTRERFAAHQTDPVCRGCHELMDNIGLGFEKYDPVGRYRETEGDDLAIDDSGEIIKSTDADGKFHGPVELSKLLVGSNQVVACTTKQFATYALGRDPADEDLCSLEPLSVGLTASELDLRQLVVAITRSDAFRNRQLVTVETCQ